jgi:hypothetical protein
MNPGIAGSGCMVPESEVGPFREKTVHPEEKGQVQHSLSVGGQPGDPSGFMTQEITFRSTDHQIHVARKLNFMGPFYFPDNHQIIPFGRGLRSRDGNR